MIRDEWKFKHRAEELAEAARSKYEHHAARLAWWKGKKEEVIAEIRSNGLEVSDTVASEYQLSSMNFTGALRGNGAKVIVKDEYQKKLTECEMKMSEHSQKSSAYDGWYQVLSANASSELEIDHDDFLFFFGK
jgi:hypothetical protein